MRKTAELLGKSFAVRLGECSSGPDAASVVTKNGRGCSERYEEGSGSKRCASRRSGAATRASLFSLDLPKSGTSPEWLVYEALRKKCMAYRIVLPMALRLRTLFGGPWAPGSCISLQHGRRPWCCFWLLSGFY